MRTLPARRLARLSLLVSVGLLATCRRAPEPPRELRVGIHSDPQSLDPHLQNELLTFAVLANVYDTLASFEGDLRIRPCLAAEWQNPDERTWRFRLRPGVRFHDGRPLEAEDVVFSLERAKRSPKSNMASYLVEVERVTAPDPNTVLLVTRRPFAVLLNKLSFVFIVPRGSPDEITSPIGTGSYRFLSYEKGKALRLAPWEGDFREARARRPLTFLPIRDPSERAAMLLSGKLDLAQDLDPADVDRVRAAKGFRSPLRLSSTVEYVHLSARDPRFADRRVREAMNLALDRDRYVADAHRGLGQPVAQLVGPGVFGYVPELVPPARDLARARRLLAEAGYPDGMELVLEHRSSRRADLVAAQLNEAGFRITTRGSPWTEIYPRVRRGEIPFYMGAVGATTADASDILDSVAHTADPSRGYGNTNFNGYGNPELDALIEKAAGTLSMTERRSTLQAAMRRLTDDLYILPLATPLDRYGVRSSLTWEPRLDRFLLGREMLEAAR